MIYVLIIFILLPLVYVGIAIMQIARISHVYDTEIQDPWQAALDAEDWDACHKYNLAAEYHISKMGEYTFNPLRWPRIPRLGNK